MDLVDTHIHLDAEDFKADLPEVLKRAKNSGINRLISIGAGYGQLSAQNAVALAQQYDFIWATVGLHPHDAKAELDLSALKKLASHHRVVGIGETGLDYYRDWAPVEMQKAWFSAQIELAKECGKPLVIHSREAGKDCLQLLQTGNAQCVGGVFHCYAEDEEFAKDLWKMNFYVSIPGSVTFKKADKLRQVVRRLPLEQILLETDGPFLAPEPYRGKRCESSFMLETAKMVASLKDVSLEYLANITSKNAQNLFKMES